MDVTEQRKARALAKAEHALQLEVDHRAKNALALVQGIVRLSNRQDGIDGFAYAISGRVDALAVAHSLLSEARWQSIAVADLVQALVKALNEDRFALEGQGPLLSPDQVQPLAVVLHELLMNVIRHGSLSQSSGRCSIEWSSAGDKIVIFVTDRGDRTSSSPPYEEDLGLGSSSRSLDGSCVARLATTGLTTA